MNQKIIKYTHHDNDVYVRKDLKGKHREFCLCFICSKFNENSKNKCNIAKDIYENCKKHGIVTPVMECPEYSEQLINGYEIIPESPK